MVKEGIPGLELSSRPPRRRRRLVSSFNCQQYRWNVQERSGSIRHSTFGLTINRRPVLDLLDESFDRSEEEFRSAPTAPVSLVFEAQGQSRASSPISRSTTVDRSFSNCISHWLAPISNRLFHQQQQQSNSLDTSCPVKSSSYSTESDRFYSLSTSTARLPVYQQRQLEPLLFYHQRVRAKQRRPLPNLPPGAHFPSRRITPVIHLL
jgi:hypothetical protein